MIVLPLSPQSLQLAQNKMRAGTAQPVKMTGLAALAMSGTMQSGDAPPALAPITPLATKTPANASVTFYALRTEKWTPKLARV